MGIYSQPFKIKVLKNIHWAVLTLKISNLPRFAIQGACRGRVMTKRVNWSGSLSSRSSPPSGPVSRL